MSEWNYIIIAPVCSILFAIGGTGYKWVRRFMMPLFIAFLGAVGGRHEVLMLGVGVGIGFTMHLGYGNSVNWAIRCLVITSYFIPMLLLGFSWCLVVFPPILIVLFWMSRKGWVTWKVWELTAGFLIGIAIGSVL